MRVVILVPRRAGNDERDRLWAWVRSWWEREHPDWEVFEGHHDTGLFNRSAAVNRAAGLADWMAPAPWDVALIIDADVLVDPERTRQAVLKADETGSMVMPFNIRKDVSLQGTARILDAYRGSWAPFVRRTYPNMVSACIAVPRRLWDAVGGFDEGFVGWGFEDNAFAVSCETFGGPIVRIKGELWHLFHHTAKEGRIGTPSFEANRRRAQRYLDARGDPDRVRALRTMAAPSFEGRPVGIPRILHRVVPERTTPEVEAYWEEFARLHPDWELRTHRDPLDPAEWPETSDHWSDCANGAQLADLIRLEALLRWGGIYVDSDCEPFRSLEPLVPLSAFAAWEDERCVPNAVMGAVPGHPAIRACLDLALSRIPGPTWPAGPGVTTEILPGRSDVLLFPPGTFYPVHYRDAARAALMDDPRLADRQPWAFLLHRYAYSWRDEKSA